MTSIRQPDVSGRVRSRTSSLPLAAIAVTPVLLTQHQGRAIPNVSPRKKRTLPPPWRKPGMLSVAYIDSTCPSLTMPERTSIISARPLGDPARPTLFGLRKTLNHPPGNPARHQRNTTAYTRPLAALRMPSPPSKPTSNMAHLSLLENTRRLPELLLSLW